ncbi:hypothetical protein MFIFM68171_03858 [Madurella fahalii]|uniref:Extracellular membrane protein CFEM domain-containing protein n=1 Tax=Madurella fahalii TaxID=1157608 RepID=A0ABQ0G7A7_9PEZI
MSCLSAVVPLSACNPSVNVTCICPESDQYPELMRCVGSRCSPKEILAVMVIESTACDRPRRTRKAALLVPLGIILPAFILLLVRFYSRWIISGQFEADDYVMMVCAVAYTAMEIINQIEGAVGFGFDLWTIRREDLALGLKLLHFVESLYIITIALAKVSLLTFYLRTFSEPHTNMRRATCCVLGFVIVVNAILLVVQIFQCIPFEANWERWNAAYNRPYPCVNVNQFLIARAGLNIAQEVIIMCLPVPTLLRLNLPLRLKMNAVAMFSLGILIVITSCTRLAYIIPLADSVNFSWDYTDGIIWTGIEAAVTIIVPCLPSLRALINRLWATPPADSSSEIILGGRASETFTGKVPFHLRTWV